MKLSKNKLAIAVGAVLSFGIAGQASADVYGLSTLAVNSLTVAFAPVAAGSGAGAFTFNTFSEARLNGSADPTDGGADCAGVFGSFNTCPGAGTPASPRLSGTVQNAPGSAVLRGENDYSIKGTGVQYSNSESAIVTALLTGDASTSTAAISESNLTTGTTASANTNVSSNTVLTLDFTGSGSFSVNFQAVLDVLAQVTVPSTGIAQANSSLGITLQQGGVTLAQWVPGGNGGFVGTCAAPLVCTATDPFSLNNTNTSAGAQDRNNGSGGFALNVSGLNVDGTYTLALNTTTSTAVFRTEVPVPGTLLLMGTGLLAGARVLRRKQ